jgi:hypothetical protein
MSNPKLIAGGGLAGWSFGGDARMNNFEPVATMPGRHLVEIVCAALDRPFVPARAAVSRTA